MRQLGTCLVAAALAAGCSSGERQEPRLAGEPPTRVVATFAGEVDVLAGSFRITAVDATSGQALTELPVVRDGVTGYGPDDTVELVTEGYTLDIPDGCAPGVNAFEGRIRLRSFYLSSCLRNAYAEIVQMAPTTGHEGCNSAPAVPGVSNALGLFPYGTLATKGRAGDSAVAAWRFRLGDATWFTFRGRILADVVPGCASPGLPGVPAVSLPAAPAGVAVADLDGDAIPDLAAVSGAAGEAALAIARGTGGGRFAAPASTPLGAGYAVPVQTALANVRGSAAADLLYTDASGNLVVRENLGGGAWGAAGAYTAAGAGALATADLDGDGDLDVAVAGTGVTAFLNGGASFTAYPAAGAASSGRAAVVADLDGDARNDVVTVNGPALVLAPQTTRGAFGFRTVVTASVSLAGADLWDVALLRSGTVLYALAANHGNSCLARFRTNAPGKAFVYEACLAIPFAPEKVAAADLDGNGTEELVVAGSGLVQVYAGNGAEPPVLTLAATYGGVPSPTALAARDVDGDGTTDLVVSSAVARAHAVVLNAGGGVLRAPGRVPAAAGAESLAAVDLNLDGRPDLVVASRAAANVAPAINAGAGAFTPGAAVALASAPVAIAGGDVTGDGRPDVAVALAGGQVCVLAGNGAGDLGAPACAAVGAAPAGLALLDLDGDGDLDAAATVDGASGEVRGFRNSAGALARDASLDGIASPRSAGMVAADVTGDGRADLLVAGDALAVLPSTGSGLGTAMLAAHDAGGRALALGDVDGDRLVDVVTTGPDELQLFLGDGAGGFAFAAAAPFPAPAGVALADLDDDGALDLAATSSTRGLAGVLRNATPSAPGVPVAFGPVSFGPLVLWPAGAAGAGIVAADLDGDLRPDLAAADPAGGAVDVLRAACLP